MQTGHFGGYLRRVALSVPKMSRDGDDRITDEETKMGRCIACQLSQDGSRNLDGRSAMATCSKLAIKWLPNHALNTANERLSHMFMFGWRSSCYQIQSWLASHERIVVPDSN